MINSEVSLTNHPLITPLHLSLIAAVYIRQSTEEQVRQNTGSTDFQRGLTDLARSYGWPDHLIEVIDEDLGITGSSTELRTGWQKLQVMIAENKVGAVFVATISRLARQVIDFEVFRILAAAHATLLIADGRVIDPGDSNDTFTSQIGAMVAQFENRKRVELMSQARMSKAKKGAVVSILPVGWVKCPDGQYEYDPEVKEGIFVIIKTFWQNRSIRRTLKALNDAGMKIPSRRGKQIWFSKPTLGAVKRFLTNPAYAGLYVYGKTKSLPGSSARANGQLPRVKVPENLWIKTVNHHPAYMTPQEQEEIKAILKANHFVIRHRPGRGKALTQGLLRCAVCKKSLSVNYNRNKSYSYGCGWDTQPCTRFISYEFDGYVLKEVFKILETPPLDILKRAHENEKNKEQAWLSWIRSEHDRLDHEKRKIEEFVESSHSHPRVHSLALDKLEAVLKEQDEFEEKIAIERTTERNDETENIEELCHLAADVPRIWHHPEVTHQERKEMLRCLIDHIVVAATKQRIDARIVWKSGHETPIAIWRDVGRYNLIRELHAQNLTVIEIRDRLAAGDTSTGQTIKITPQRLYVILRKLGLTPNRCSEDHVALRREAAQLNRDGRPFKWIADHFNDRGYKSPSGTRWTRSMINGLIRAVGDRAYLLEDLHRAAITEARARGLRYREMAIEFNAKKVRRRDGQPWTERDIKKRWGDLNRLQRNRIAKRLTTTELSEPVVVPASI